MCDVDLGFKVNVVLLGRDNGLHVFEDGGRGVQLP